MTLWYLIWLAVAVALDGMLAGFVHGAAGVRISGWRAAYVGGFSLPVTAGALLCARFAQRFVPLSAGAVLGGAGLIAAGVMALLEARKVRGMPTEVKPLTLAAGAVLGLSVATDAGMAAFSAGLLGAPIVSCVLFSAMHVALVAAGNWAGRAGTARLGARVPFLPGAMLILMGLLRLPIFH